MTETTSPTLPPDTSPQQGTDFLYSLRIFMRNLTRNKIGFIGTLMIIAFIILAFVMPQFVPKEIKADVTKIYEPPSKEHPLGTDSQGKDIWAQIVHGGADILTMAFLTGIIATFIGVTLGSLSAVVGGALDSLLTTLADIWLTIPRFPLLAVLAGMMQLDSTVTLALILAILSWAGLYRAIRAQVFSIKERDYIEAAVALDLGLRHIIFSEILPNMMAYIAINFTLAMTGAIYAQVGLVFLGLVPLRRNWGVMINLAWTQGAIFFKDSIYFIMAPVTAIALFQLSIVWMSRSLEEIFNPRLRAGR
ncbi:MAG: ABC transporter permease [Chloroflexota bacterium]|nr:ABC transporter permease [Chloroflexota bacterium]